MSKQPSKKENNSKKRTVQKTVSADGKTKIVYVRRSFLWNVIAILLAFILGAGAAIGGIIFAANKISLKSALGLVNISYENFLTEEAASKSLVGLIADFSSTDWSSLQAIDKYSPLMRKKLEALNDKGGQLDSMGVTLNVDEFISTPFGNLGTYVQDSVVQEIIVGKLMNVNADSSAMMKELCYGTEGVNYTVNAETKEIVPIVPDATPTAEVAEPQLPPIVYPITVRTFKERSNELIDNMLVETAFGTNANSKEMMRYLAYGNEGEHYDIVTEGETKTVVMRTDPATGKPYEKRKISAITEENSEVINSMTVASLATIDENSSTFLKAIKNWTINELKQQKRIERLKIDQIVKIDENSSSLMKAIEQKGWRIEDMADQDKMNELKLSDVIEVKEDDPNTPENEASPLILQALKDTTLGGISKKIDSLVLSDVIEKSELEGNKILKHLAYTPVNALSSAITTLSVREVFGEEIFTYTTAEDYAAVQAETAPAKTKIKHANVLSSYVLASNESVILSEGRFFFDADTNVYHLLGDANVYEQKTPVTYSAVYKKVNYDTGVLEDLSADEQEQITLGNLFTEDAFSDYIQVNGTRIDVQKVENFTYPATGTAVPSDVEKREIDGTWYVVTPRTDNLVTRLYQAQADVTEYTTVYEPTNAAVEQLHIAAVDMTAEETGGVAIAQGTRLYEFLDGMWWLSMDYQLKATQEDPDADKTDPLDKSILDVAMILSETTSKLNEVTMHQFYVHGLANSEPKDVILPGQTKSLQQFTINEVIQYLNSIGT